MKTFSKYLEGKNQEDVFGWLSPSGKFYSCGMFDHAIVVLSSSELRKYLSKETLEAVDKQIYGNEADKQVSVDMYKSGFLRIGVNPADNDSPVYFEGTSEAIKNLYNKAKDLAEQQDRKASFYTRKI